MTFDEYQELNEELGMFEADVFWAACLLTNRSTKNLVFRKCQMNIHEDENVTIKLVFKDPSSRKEHPEHAVLNKKEVENMLIENRKVVKE